MLINRYILRYVFFSWAMISLCFFPLLYLSDFLFHENFSTVIALKKVILRYGQSLNIVVFWSVWLAIKKLRNQYTDMAFFSVGFRRKDAWPVLAVLFLFFAVLEWGVIIPSNKLFFDPKVKVLNWSVNNKNSNMFLLNAKRVSGSNGYVWIRYSDKVNLRYCEGIIKKDWFESKTCLFVNDPVNGWQEEKVDLRLPAKELDFYTIWKEPRKLSWSGLKEAQKYWDYHNIVFNEIKSQFHVFLARVFLLLGLIICGYCWAWENGISKMLFASILSSWLGQISIFLSLLPAILIIWFNVFIWFVWGLICLF